MQGRLSTLVTFMKVICYVSKVLEIFQSKEHFVSSRVCGGQSRQLCQVVIGSSYCHNHEVRFRELKYNNNDLI